MTTRRSTRNLRQHELQAQSGDTSDEDTCRDYDLNYDKAIKKKAKACNVEYSVRGGVKGENHVFSFSTAMYELYRDNLIEHLRGLNDNPDANIKVQCKDISEKSGMVVESQLKVYQRAQNGGSKLNYTINLYHTNNRMMVNGKMASRFNTEHLRITEQILAREQVSILNQAMSAQIQDELKSIIVSRSQKRPSRVEMGGPGSPPVEVNVSGPSIQPDDTTDIARFEEDSEPLKCPTCKHL
ncbi:MAG: hypothetical protein AB2693_27925, partial [Candidatus Thiodiazotropha sp.]